jgi:hypothetical protein
MDLHLKDVIFNKIFTNEIIYDEDEANLIREYFTKYDLLNTKAFKEKIRNAKNLSFRRLFRAFDPNILPGYIWNLLLTPDYIFNLHYIKEIPEKYQIRIINKNPYYIQYINNPTEKVIKMAKEKVPNIKDFI